MYLFFEQLLKNLHKFALVMCSLSGIVLLGVKLWLLASYHPDISGSETSTIFPIQLLLDGRSMYSDPEQPQFILSQYTPFYFSISAFLLKVSPWVADDLQRVYFVSRTLSLFFLLSTIVLFVALVYKITKNLVIGVLGGLLVFHILGLWFLTGSRPDSLLVLATVVFLFVVVKALDSGGKGDKWWYVATCVAIASFFVKQSGVIQFITICAFCVFESRWKLLMRLVPVGMLMFGLMLLVLPVGDLNVFFANIVGGVANSISFGWFYDWTLRNLLQSFGLYLAAGFALSLHWLSRPSEPIYRFLAIALVLYFFFDITISLKIGAGVGYFQDYILVCVLSIALYLNEVSKKYIGEPGFLRNTLLLYITLFCCHCSLYVLLNYQKEPMRGYEANYIKERALSEFLYKEKQLAAGEWVHLDVGGEHFSGYFLTHFLFRNVIMPFKDIVELGHANKTFDFSAVKGLIKNGKIRFVISNRGTPPEGILNYRFGNTLSYCCSVEGFDIYQTVRQ